jgi:hypothetical protein
MSLGARLQVEAGYENHRCTLFDESAKGFEAELICVFRSSVCVTGGNSAHQAWCIGP